MKRVSLAGLAFQLWIHRQLTALGIECVVVNPADIPKSQKDKLQKRMPTIHATLAIVS